MKNSQANLHDGNIQKQRPITGGYLGYLVQLYTANLEHSRVLACTCLSTYLGTYNLSLLQEWWRCSRNFTA